MLVTFKMKYVQYWTDEYGRKRYRVRRKGKYLGELPVNGDPSSPEFQAAYHALLRGENMSDAGRPRFDPKNRAKNVQIAKDGEKAKAEINPFDDAPVDPGSRKRKTKTPC
jgi:hypothetical protein